MFVLDDNLPDLTVSLPPLDTSQAMVFLDLLDAIYQSIWSVHDKEIVKVMIQQNEEEAAEREELKHLEEHSMQNGYDDLPW